ncbi:MAG: hypothetical protein ABIH64_00230 [Nanoarchaeota archaeon]
MEFLMTYGWAILVVLIAIGALAYFGVLSPEKFLPEKCVISSGSGLFCQEFSATAGTGVTLRIKNILTDSVSVTAASTDVPSCTWTGTGAIAADGYTDFPLACTGIASKDKIKATVTVAYSVGASGLPKSTTGQLVTVVP